MRSDEVVHYRNGRIFTASDERPWAESVVVDGALIRFVGPTVDADRLPGIDRTVELDGAVLLPGFVEAHSHLVNLGRSLDQVNLFDVADLAEAQRRLSVAAAQRPDAARILGRSWLLGPLAGEQPHRRMLDAAVPDRPVYLTSNDLHSGWVNSAALAELGIDRSTPDPAGGTIVRDADGDATGLLLETAALVLMRGGVERLEDDSVRDAALARALDRYCAAGVTAVADLGLRDAEFAALDRARARGALPIPVAGYLRVERCRTRAEELAQVERAVETRARVEGAGSPMLRVAGVKVWIDGVIDSGTAAMREPFGDGSRPETLWSREALEAVVVAADAAGMQVAMHAIGDAAVELGIDAVEAALRTNGDRGLRHRLEHLEVVAPSSLERLARLGITASVQPVHADPAVQHAWRERLGDARAARGYPWAELDRAGVRLALGTDAPTAPYAPLPNLFIAATRSSASDSGLPANRPEQALPLERALVAATRGAAGACGWTDRGVLAAGLRADFVVLDRDPFAEGPEVLRDATPAAVVIGGVERPRSGTPRRSVLRPGA